MPSSRDPHSGKSFRLITLGSAALLEATGSRVAEQRRRLALLALVASSGERGISRDRLIVALSPESSTESARHALQQLLYYLRQQVGDDVFLGTDPLRLNRQRVAFDVAEFEASITEGALERAALIYGGPFLDGFHLAESGEFEEWASGERARLAARHRDVLLQLARRAGEIGDHAAAVKWWAALTAVDPFSATVALEMMGALVSSGERIEAMRHGQRYQSLVRAELAMEPDAAIETYIASLRTAPGTVLDLVGPSPAGEDALPHAPVIRVTRGDDMSSATAAVSSASAGAALPADRRRRLRARGWSLLGVALLSGSVAVIASDRASVREERSIAIVPLQNGAEDSLDYVVEGLASTATERLSRVPGLRVIATSVMRQYDAPTNDLGALGRRVGVAALLTGRLTRERDTLRFSFEVVRSRDGARLAGGRFVIDASRLTALDSDLIDAVTVGLGLAANDKRRVLATDGEASLLIWRADHFLLNRDSASLWRARDLYNAAIERDPALAAAHAGLSSAYGALGEYGFMPAPDAFELANAAVREAIALDPQSAVAIANLAHAQGMRFYRWDEALSGLRRAAALEPWRATIWNQLGTTLRRMGRFDESVAAFRRAQGLDPLSRHYYRQIAYAFRCAGHYDSALVAIRKGLALGGRYPEGHRMAAEILAGLERYDDALTELGLMAREAGNSAMAATLNGARGKAGWERVMIADASRRLNASPPNVLTGRTARAGLAARIGDINRAFDLLEQAHHDRETAVSEIACTSVYEPWRTHPRFIRLMSAMNLTPASLGATGQRATLPR
jgi:DNA-binding SARP family transcriptional activator/TolB-like protein